MYDTHDDQPQALADGLKLTADSLLAFQRDLEARGLADRVLVHVWSEFGRRAQENGSNGTDHGAAGAGFLIGSRASGTMVGEFPGLAKLDEQGNLRATSDFRGLYGSLLEQWLGDGRRGDHPGRPQVRPARSWSSDRDRARPAARSRRPRPPASRSAPTSSATRSPARRSRQGRRSCSSSTTARTSTTFACAGPAGARTYRIGTVAPGRVGELEARFLPGRFTLWCSLADHRARGMRATLVVRRLDGADPSNDNCVRGFRCGGGPASIGCDVHPRREPSCRCSKRSSRCSPVVRPIRGCPRGTRPRPAGHDHSHEPAAPPLPQADMAETPAAEPTDSTPD